MPRTTTIVTARVSVLIVGAGDACLGEVRSAVLAVAPSAVIDTVPTALDAIRHSMAGPLHLAVVDAAGDSAGVMALMRHLHRTQAQVAVLAFDDLAAASSPAVRPWHELPRALARWAARDDAARSTRS